MKIYEQIKQYADKLRLALLKNNFESITHSAQINKPSYLEFTHKFLEQKILKCRKTNYNRWLKMAKIPPNNDLDSLDFNFSEAISKLELKQLTKLFG
ncbi:MAG: hypothetical protein JXR68_05960 [Bacteroidales bacterium]|nr:hypothetical protein [Bacteroidales bacterium]